MLRAVLTGLLILFLTGCQVSSAKTGAREFVVNGKVLQDVTVEDGGLYRLGSVTDSDDQIVQRLLAATNSWPKRPDGRYMDEITIEFVGDKSKASPAMMDAVYQCTLVTKDGQQYLAPHGRMIIPTKFDWEKGVATYRKEQLLEEPNAEGGMTAWAGVILWNAPVPTSAHESQRVYILFYNWMEERAKYDN